MNPFAHPWKIFHSPGSNLGGGSNVTPAIKQQTHCFGGWSMENGMKMLSPPPNPLSHPTANTEKCTLLLGEGAARLSTGRKWKLHHIYRRGFVQCALKLFRFYQWRGAVPFLSDGRHRSATAKLLLFFCETAQSCPISRSFFLVCSWPSLLMLQIFMVLYVHILDCETRWKMRNLLPLMVT